MTGFKKTATALATILLVSAGCMSTGKGGPQTTHEFIEGGEGAVELDSGLQLSKDLEIYNYISERRDGYLVGQFELHNKRGSQIALEWTVDWFDGSKFKIDTNESWRPLKIGGKGFEVVQIIGPTPEAHSWRLKVQKPNPVR